MSGGRLLRDWPAIALPSTAPLGGPLRIERAVHGKVHLQPTDFRWIARTRGMVGCDRELVNALFTSGRREGRAVPRQAWLVHHDRFIAVTYYPTAAVDASARSGVEEKQLLQAYRAPQLPAALASLLLLPRVAASNQALGMDLHRDPGFDGADYVASLPDEAALPIDEEQLDRAAKTAVERLLERFAAAHDGRPDEALATEELARFYANILDGRQGILGGVAGPVPPEVMAALLLPLPRSLADGLSLAGWLPADMAADLRPSWQGALTDRAQREGGSVDRGSTAYQLAVALVERNPMRLRDRPVVTTAMRAALEALPSVLRAPLQAGDLRQVAMVATGERDRANLLPTLRSLPGWRPAVLGALELLATRLAGDPLPRAYELRSWLQREGDEPLDDGALEDLVAWGRILVACGVGGAEAEVGNTLRLLRRRPEPGVQQAARLVEFALSDAYALLPEDLGAAEDPRAWVDLASLIATCIRRLEAETNQTARATATAIKIDLLRAALIAFWPSPRALELAGDFRSGRVPPLTYAASLAPEAWDHLGGLGETGLAQAVAKSLQPGLHPGLAGSMRTFFHSWSSSPPAAVWVGELLDQVFEPTGRR